LNTVLWTAQILVALVVTLTGTAKLVFARERLAVRMHWAPTWPRGRIKLLGLAEVAGAAGLVLPMATGIAPVLTPVAALCLAVLMVGAVRTHQRLREGFGPAMVLGALCVVVAAGRFAAPPPSAAPVSEPPPASREAFTCVSEPASADGEDGSDLPSSTSVYASRGVASSPPRTARATRPDRAGRGVPSERSSAAPAGREATGTPSARCTCGRR
jgi:hypothetical protein